MSEGYKNRIGNLIRDARKHRGLTQHQLADVLGTSQSAINRIEKGHQNLSLDMLARIGSALDSEIVALGAGPTHLRVTGPTTLSGAIDVKTHEVETADIVAERLRKALKFVPAERIFVLPDCGCLHLPQEVAFAKLKAMVQGTKIIRKELGG